MISKHIKYGSYIVDLVIRNITVQTDLKTDASWEKYTYLKKIYLKLYGQRRHQLNEMVSSGCPSPSWKLAMCGARARGWGQTHYYRSLTHASVGYGVARWVSARPVACYPRPYLFLSIKWLKQLKLFFTKIRPIIPLTKIPLVRKKVWRKDGEIGFGQQTITTNH